MNDIDFIKWMCDRAEGFECITEKDGYLWVQTPGGQRVSGEWLALNSRETYPLLQQRCLREMVKRGRIYHDFNSLRDLLLDDKKLESWLKYQWEKDCGKMEVN